MQAVEQKMPRRGRRDARSHGAGEPDGRLDAGRRHQGRGAVDQGRGGRGQRRIEEAKANLATRQEWLSEAEKSAGRR